MSNHGSNASFKDSSSTTYLIRWRGLQYGPFTASTIEQKLSTNQLSFLHEISYNGRWMTLRDFAAEREAIERAELQARKAQEQHARDEAARKAAEREEQNRRIREKEERQASNQANQHRREALAEERRRNDLQLSHFQNQQSFDHSKQGNSEPLEPHQGWNILGWALGSWGIIILIILAGIIEPSGKRAWLPEIFSFGLALRAWVEGNSDLEKMDARIMDNSGRTMTLWGRGIGAVSTVLDVIGYGIELLLFLARK